MKKDTIRITIFLMALVLIFTMFYSKPVEAISTTLSASSATVESGENFSITITSSLSLSGWTIDLANNGGCTFSSVSVASGAIGETNGTKILGISNGTKTLATYKFKAPSVTKDTKYTITFSATEMADESSDNEVDDTSCSATVTVKAKNTSSSGGSSSSGNSGSSSSGSSTTKKPTFKSVDDTVYTKQECNLRSSWSTSSSATSVPAGTELKLTGTSTEKDNDGNTWYRVTYNGATKYIASFLITYDKPEKEEEEEKSSNKNLSSLSIEGVEMTPEFKKETTQYTATVDGDVTELKIDAKAEDSKAKVTVEGNENLQEGDNVIKVKVTAEDNTTRTYFITVKKGEGTITDDTLKLSALTIERVNFEGAFSPDTYTYELPLNTLVDSLEITATPNQADATVEIIGNSNFQIGENVVTILLTSADGTETATYQIKVNIAEGATVEEEESELGMPVYIGIGVGIAIVIIAIYIIIKRRRAKKDEELDENTDNSDGNININLMSRYETDDENMNKKPKKEQKEDKLDDFIKNDEEEKNEGKPKKPKGRHSM